MKTTNDGKPWEIMLVEDNKGDIGLVEEAFSDSGIIYNLKAITNGREALEYLKRKNGKGYDNPPDLIILDLNLPILGGLDVLKEIKTDEKLDQIPVVILTTSEAEKDIFNSYKLKANSYVTKPVDFDEFMDIVNNIKDYWLSIVKLPPKKYLVSG
ncbi:MAG: response regulator [Ignavibacteria bacterium]|nr:response regulator [Ignavibacteria bacterium]MCU7502239.1 response regulator [Ignavibacteria bacterium]MCU7516717.1 response regulator [Ignavibacteria bacterium]